MMPESVVFLGCRAPGVVVCAAVCRRVSDCSGSSWPRACRTVLSGQKLIQRPLPGVARAESPEARRELATSMDGAAASRTPSEVNEPRSVRVAPRRRLMSIATTVQPARLQVETSSGAPPRPSLPERPRLAGALVIEGAYDLSSMRWTQTIAPTVACSGCGVVSGWVHSRYVRQLSDAASSGREVLIRLRESRDRVSWTQGVLSLRQAACSALRARFPR